MRRPAHGQPALRSLSVSCLVDRGHLTAVEASDTKSVIGKPPAAFFRPPITRTLSDTPF
jgi:hypothetical protein